LDNAVALSRTSASFTCIEIHYTTDRQSVTDDLYNTVVHKQFKCQSQVT